MVMTLRIILVSFNDQKHLKVDCQDKKYPGDFLGGGSMKLLKFVSMFICAFFPGKKIHKSPKWSMASPDDPLRSKEFKWCD